MFQSVLQEGIEVNLLRRNGSEAVMLWLEEDQTLCWARQNGKPRTVNLDDVSSVKITDDDSKAAPDCGFSMNFKDGSVRQFEAQVRHPMRDSRLSLECI